MIVKEFELKPFDINNPDLPAITLAAQIRINQNDISFHFKMKGDIDSIYLSKDNGKDNGKDNKKYNRVIGLWTQTCFEFFILSKQDGEYYEFNFASDSSWNCFIFNSYRSELTEYEEIDLKNININYDQRVFDLECRFNLSVLGHQFEDLSNIKVSPACVIKTCHDKTLYYANKHPDSVANFHHPESFVDLI